MLLAFVAGEEMTHTEFKNELLSAAKFLEDLAYQVDQLAANAHDEKLPGFAQHIEDVAGAMRRRAAQIQGKLK